MGKLIEFLQGKKTYLQAAGIALVVGLLYSGVISQEIGEVAIGLLGAGSLASLAAKVERKG